MEGEDPEKPEKEKEEDEKTLSLPLEELSLEDKISSNVTMPKGSSIQQIAVTSSVLDSASVLPEGTGKSSVTIRSTGTKASVSKKLTASILNEADELVEIKPKMQVFEERVAGMSEQKAFPVSFLTNRSPFAHNPPEPEEPRARIQNPRTPKEYIINLREDLADFQESHGLPRTRDYSFVSLGLALAQETLRAIYSVFLMFAELFPILAIVSLILRFALDKLIEILETPEPVSKVKKAIIFALEMLVILIPLWILIGTIVLPMMSLIFSIFKRVFRLKGGKKKSHAKPKPKQKAKTEMCGFF